MVHAQFETSQFSHTDSNLSSKTDSASIRLFDEVQSLSKLSSPSTYQANDKAISSARGTVGGDSSDTKVINKEVDKIMGGFEIKGDEEASRKQAIACRMMKGQTIEYGRITSTVKDGEKPLVPGRDGPTDQDRASRFERYLWNLCHQTK